MSVAASGSNGRVVEPLSHHPEGKGSSPATGTRREKNGGKKIFLTFFNIFSLLVSVAATGRNGRVVEHLSHHPDAKGSSPPTGIRRERNGGKSIFNFFLYISLF